MTDDVKIGIDMADDVKILLEFVLEYGCKGWLPSMDEGGSGDIAYKAALRLDSSLPEDWGDQEVNRVRYPSLPTRS